MNHPPQQRAAVVETSILQLYALTHKFIRYELMHAGIAVGVFSILFLVLKPWDDTYYYEDTHPFWFVGPPMVYFTLDLFLAGFLLLALRNELRPRRCLVWVALQVANLILLTILGFYMVWNYYYRGSTYLRLTLALFVLYCFKAYRIAKMHKLIIAMRNHCTVSFSVTQMTEVPHVPQPVYNFRSPYTIPSQFQAPSPRFSQEKF